MNTPTPETDAVVRSHVEDGPFVTDHHILLADFARKLERERDEARQREECNRQATDLVRRVLGEVQSERDQLRKVVDEAKKVILDFKVGVAFVKSMTPQGQDAFAKPIHASDQFSELYNSLPHIIAQKGNKAQ